jgi:hypothetical protein
VTRAEPREGMEGGHGKGAQPRRSGKGGDGGARCSAELVAVAPFHPPPSPPRA